MFHKHPRNDTTSAQVSLPSLKDYIKEVQKQESDLIIEDPLEEAYIRGFLEGKKQGFQDGITWVKGK